MNASTRSASPAVGLAAVGPAVRRFMRLAQEAISGMVDVLARATTWATAWLPQYVAGLEARYYVRAGLDPQVDDIDQLVRDIRTGRAPGLSLLGQAARTQVALAAMRGWAVHRTEPAGDVLAWHRQLGGTRVLVGRAAA